eukprot:m.4870 g.4870  ORF g.4870 m.4870 type:complete len:1791 (+) comp1949_c0_seq1:25-5397(+)
MAALLLMAAAALACAQAQSERATTAVLHRAEGVLVARIASSTKNFTLHLRDVSHEVLDPTGFYGAQGLDGHTRSSLAHTLRWYAGEVAGERDSRVLLAHTAAGQFHGAVHARRATHIIESTWDAARNTEHTVVYRSDAVPMQPYRISHPAHAAAVPAAPDSYHGGHGPASRARRAEGALNGSRCSVFLDGDQAFFDQWGGGCATGDNATACLDRRLTRALLKMITITAQSADIYLSQKNFNGTFGLLIAGAMIHLNRSLGFSSTATSPVTGDDILDAYKTFLGSGTTGSGTSATTAAVRGNGVATSHDVCVNHLFTHSYSDGFLGKTTLASTDPSQIGGICAFMPLRKGGSGPFQALNTGYTNTLSPNGPVALWQAVLTTAHEYAHGFGALHDCASTPRPSACCPADADGGLYLMYATSTHYPSLANARVFSACSMAEMVPVIQAKGTCLVPPNPCAYGGSCCTNGTLRPSGSPCRAADSTNPCAAAAVCNGIDAFCPDAWQPDGAVCTPRADDPSTGGLCYQGVCGSPHEQLCQTQLGLRGCAIPGFECVPACLSDDGSSCTQYAASCGIVVNDQLTSWVGAGGCPYDLSGTPCLRYGGSGGQCSGGAYCTATTTPPPCTAWSAWSTCKSCAATRTRTGPLCASPTTLFKACCGVSLVLDTALGAFNSTALVQTIQQVSGLAVELISTPTAVGRRLLAGQTVVSVGAVNSSTATVQSAIVINRITIQSRLGYAVTIASSSTGTDSSPSEGEAAGIAIGVIAGVAGIVVAIYAVIRLTRRPNYRRRLSPAAFDKPPSALHPVPSPRSGLPRPVPATRGPKSDVFFGQQAAPIYTQQHTSAGISKTPRASPRSFNPVSPFGRSASIALPQPGPRTATTSPPQSPMMLSPMSLAMSPLDQQLPWTQARPTSPAERSQRSPQSARRLLTPVRPAPPPPIQATARKADRVQPVPSPRTSRRGPRPSLTLAQPKFVRCLYAFDGGSAPNMLRMAPGEIVELISHDSSAPWWYGAINGRRGYFPRDFVSMCLFDSSETDLIVELPPASPRPVLPAEEPARSSGLSARPSTATPEPRFYESLVGLRSSPSLRSNPYESLVGLRSSPSLRSNPSIRSNPSVRGIPFPRAPSPNPRAPSPRPRPRSTIEAASPSPSPGIYAGPVYVALQHSQTNIFSACEASDSPRPSDSLAASTSEPSASQSQSGFFNFARGQSGEYVPLRIGESSSSDEEDSPRADIDVGEFDDDLLSSSVCSSIVITVRDEAIPVLAAARIAPPATAVTTSTTSARTSTPDTALPRAPASAPSAAGPAIAAVPSQAVPVVVARARSRTASEAGPSPDPIPTVPPRSAAQAAPVPASVQAAAIAPRAFALTSKPEEAALVSASSTSAPRRISPPLPPPPPPATGSASDASISLSLALAAARAVAPASGGLSGAADEAAPRGVALTSGRVSVSASSADASSRGVALASGRVSVSAASADASTRGAARASADAGERRAPRPSLMREVVAALSSMAADAFTELDETEAVVLSGAFTPQHSNISATDSVPDSVTPQPAGPAARTSPSQTMGHSSPQADLDTPKTVFTPASCATQFQDSRMQRASPATPSSLQNRSRHPSIQGLQQADPCTPNAQQAEPRTPQQTQQADLCTPTTEQAEPCTPNTQLEPSTPQTAGFPLTPLTAEPDDWLVVVHSFEARTVLELSVVAGDRVRVLDRVGDYVRVEAGPRSGYIPYSYTRVASPEHSQWYGTAPRLSIMTLSSVSTDGAEDPDLDMTDDDQRLRRSTVIMITPVFEDDEGGEC